VEETSEETPDGEVVKTFKRLLGKMTVVDLSGSERVKKSQPDSKGLKRDIR
jgi:hypothetical protein